MIGTLTHELGHFAVAKCIGIKPIMHYGSCTYLNADGQITKMSIFLLNASGPIFTIAFGSIGFISQFTGIPDLPIRILINRTLALFWVREVLVCIIYMVFHCLGITWHGDEVRCADILGMNPAYLILLFGLFGLFISVYTLFYYSKLDQKEFTIGAFIGSVVGGVLWFSWIGPILLP
jgi:hypothetical protein